MAFVDQVQDLTSLTASDTDELSQFLKDGVIDVTNRWLALRPQDIELFGRESAEQTANESLNLNGARIISVVRENGTNNQWRPCRKISVSAQYDVTDEESLGYASKINPAYMVGNNGQISVFPTPGSDPDSFKVYYVNNDPEDKSGANLIHSHSDIGYFLDDKVYLVIMYAGMRLIQTEIGSIANLSITAVPPDTPSAPSFSGATVTLGTAPTYDATVAASALTEANNFIDSDEDVELANAKLAEVQALMQDELNEFNQENIAYQAVLQKGIQDAQLSQTKEFTEYANTLQRFQNEVAAYQADITSQVQEHTASIQGLQAQYTLLRRDYDSAFGIAAPKQQPQAAQQPQARQ